MQKMKSILLLVLWLTSGAILAQAGQQRVDAKGTASLDVEREKHALQVFSKLAENAIVSAADAMPADKYGFAPTDGEFKGVRTFGQMVKHLSATNYILAAAALGEEPPADDFAVKLAPHATTQRANRLRSPRNTSVANPVTGPTPGCVSSRRACGRCWHCHSICWSSSSIRFCNCPYKLNNSSRL